MCDTTFSFSFYGNPDLKTHLVTRLRQHRAAGELRQVQHLTLDHHGQFEGSPLGWGVTDALAAAKDVDLDALSRAPKSRARHEFLDWPEFEEWDERDAWAEEWTRVSGLPMWLALSLDILFREMPPLVAPGWPERLLAATPVGADLVAAHTTWVRSRILDPDAGAFALAAASLERTGIADGAARLRAVPEGADWAEARAVMFQVLEDATERKGETKVAEDAAAAVRSADNGHDHWAVVYAGWAAGFETGTIRHAATEDYAAAQGERLIAILAGRG